MRSGTSLSGIFDGPLQRVARRKLLEDDGIMSEKVVSLIPRQLQVLSWVRDGCPVRPGLRRNQQRDFLGAVHDILELSGAPGAAVGLVPGHVRLYGH